MTPPVERKTAQDRIAKYIKTSGTKNDKHATLRMIANEEPHEVGHALQEMAGVFHAVASVFSGLAGDTEAMHSNLDLTEPARTASLRDRVAARRKYAATLRMIANETPEELGAALSEIYRQVDDAMEGIEILADKFGIQLQAEDNLEAPPDEMPATEPTPPMPEEQQEEPPMEAPPPPRMAKKRVA